MTNRNQRSWRGASSRSRASSTHRVSWQREARRKGGVPEEEVVTVTFNDLGEETEMVFHQVGYLPEELIPRSKEGWSSFFDRLAEYLAHARQG
jgi:uncharacterized protein YndB with AHSA1/START domain